MVITFISHFDTNGTCHVQSLRNPVASEECFHNFRKFSKINVQLSARLLEIIPENLLLNTPKYSNFWSTYLMVIVLAVQ